MLQFIQYGSYLEHILEITFVNNAGLLYFLWNVSFFITGIIEMVYIWSLFSCLSIYYSTSLCFYWTTKIYTWVLSVKMFYFWGQRYFDHVHHRPLDHFFNINILCIFYNWSVCVWGRKLCPVCNNRDASKWIQLILEDIVLVCWEMDDHIVQLLLSDIGFTFNMFISAFMICIMLCLQIGKSSWGW